MAEPWIRVHAGLIDKPVIDRATAVLGVSEHEAIGLMVTFWGSVSQNVIRGQVGDASDRQIERWARWAGRRGVFAKFIRDHHLDEDGRVNEWDEYAGALETRRERERDRLRNKRHSVAQLPGNTADDVAQHDELNGDGVRKMLQPARANETIRDDKNRVVVSAQPAAEPEPPKEKPQPHQPNERLQRAIDLAAAANRGLAEHAGQPQPIPLIIGTSGRTHEAATEIADAGVDHDFAVAEVYGLAKTHTADGQVSSLRYFVPAVIRAWQRKQAADDAGDWTPPSAAAAGTNGRGRKPDRFAGDRNDAAIDRWLAQSSDETEPQPIAVDDHGE